MIEIARAAQLVREVTANTHLDTLFISIICPELIGNNNVWQYQVKEIYFLFINIARTA
jgi:hypothetical protein